MASSLSSQKYLDRIVNMGTFSTLQVCLSPCLHFSFMIDRLTNVTIFLLVLLFPQKKRKQGRFSYVFTFHIFLIFTNSLGSILLHVALTSMYDFFYILRIFGDTSIALITH